MHVILATIVDMPLIVVLGVVESQILDDTVGWSVAIKYWRLARTHSL
jgi:hypothetical protein